MYQGNNRNQHRAPRPASPSFSFKQVKLASTPDGTRHLFRAELNGKVTGFVEKHFKGETLVREFALGGPRNGVDEAVATARFNGVEIKPAPAPTPEPPKAKPTTTAGLPAFITKPEPVLPGKSTKPKPRPASVAKVVSKPKLSGERRPDHKPLTRKEGLELAGSLLRNR